MIHNANKERLKHKIKINVILLVSFILLMLLGVFIMRKQLVDNSVETNALLLENYAVAEESTFNTYQVLLTIETQILDREELEDASLEEIKEALYSYLEQFDRLYTGDAIRNYGVVDGHIISSDELYEDYDDGVYDYRSTEWYQGALEADGAIYITDAYRDSMTGEFVITLSQKAQNSDSVLGFDIFVEDYHDGKTQFSLPDNAAYYLCDHNGTIIYSDTTNYDSYKEIQEFADWLLPQMNEHEGKGYLDNFTDARGHQRSAHSLKLSNGWTILLTVPQVNSIGTMRIFYVVLGVIILFGVILIACLSVRDYIGEKRNQTLLAEQREMENTHHIYQNAMDSTLQAYREVTYLDLEENTYQIIYPKNGDGPFSGNYQQNLRRLFAEGILKSDDNTDAKQILGLDNIRQELAHKEYMEVRCHRLDTEGVLESCVITITAVDRKNSKPVSATLVIRSIENVLREEENQRELLIVAVQRAEAASRAKSDFLSNMSHDIRTPMNAIMGMTAIAEMHIDDKGRVLDALQKITVSGKHLLGLINSVLDMSKIESGTISLQEDPFDLSVTVDGLLSIFHSQIEAKKQKLETDISQITHRKVVGDEQRLQQILINILGNAVKFTPDGGSIFLTVCEKESQVKDRGYYEFIIEDTGIGMEQKFIDKIFEPFTRAADSRTTKIEGSGLGMSIAVNVARMMGGDIQVESELGKGSKFTVNVYLQINNDQNEIPNQAGTGLEESSDLDCHGKRALLVDDNELNLEVAEELLEMLGMTVEKANNGRNAVQAVSERPAGYYDLVFMDVQMPIMNGYEATMAIRSMDRKDLKELPIIAMTADAFADDVRKAEEAGMNGHIAKPVDILKLKKIIKKWIFRDIQN